MMASFWLCSPSEASKKGVPYVETDDYGVGEIGINSKRNSAVAAIVSGVTLRCWWKRLVNKRESPLIWLGPQLVLSQTQGPKGSYFCQSFLIVWVGVGDNSISQQSVVSTYPRHISRLRGNHRFGIGGNVDHVDPLLRWFPWNSSPGLPSGKRGAAGLPIVVCPTLGYRNRPSRRSAWRVFGVLNPQARWVRAFVRSLLVSLHTLALILNVNSSNPLRNTSVHGCFPFR